MSRLHTYIGPILFRARVIHRLLMQCAAAIIGTTGARIFKTDSRTSFHQSAAIFIPERAFPKLEGVGLEKKKK